MNMVEGTDSSKNPGDCTCVDVYKCQRGHRFSVTHSENPTTYIPCAFCEGWARIDDEGRVEVHKS